MSAQLQAPPPPDPAAVERGCRNLIAAVIDLAIEDARGRDGQAEMKPARDWLFGRDDAPGTFAWYCRLLGLDADRARVFVRRRLEAQGTLGGPGGRCPRT
jgi:hypothetical protein